MNWMWCLDGLIYNRIQILRGITCFTLKHSVEREERHDWRMSSGGAFQKNYRNIACCQWQLRCLTIQL